jgi:hypothetical protein
MLGRRVVLVRDLDRGLLDRRVALEVGPDEVAVEGPVVLRVSRGVDADVPAAIGDVVLEGRLLIVVEHVARRAQEDHGVVLPKVVGTERRRVLRGVDREVVGRPELFDTGHARLDRVVPEALGLREHQDLELGCGRCHRWEREHAQGRDEAGQNGSLSHGGASLPFWISPPSTRTSSTSLHPVSAAAPDGLLPLLPGVPRTSGGSYQNDP